ncbi:4'-phosphopantetheinyl transferase superfamily protein [Luteibacter sp. SG786]|uniref:4'-phosphopantetheinyl transferase superfamily protein n=1 Tax=Luteibacter sp. SG786 TaxID=2587130 RepID=UPI00141E2834|nr:4'-phosphopantetheinyl transferase [Luteibacter sp. SG786]
MAGRPVLVDAGFPLPRGDFACAMTGELHAAGFSIPRADQACVVVFDARAMATYAPLAMDVLDRRERARAARFRFRRDRDTYVLAHAAWRVALGICLGVDAREVPLACTGDGQPCLAGTTLSTSLSHSSEYVAFAVCPAATVGVDVEQWPARIDLEALMPMFCTREERAAMASLDEGERTRALLELWTRKEALLKAFGVGLLADPATVAAPAGHAQMPPAKALHYPPCHTRNLPADDGWIGALAAPPAIRDIRLHRLRDGHSD